MILQSLLAALVYIFIAVILAISGATSGIPVVAALPISISALTLFFYAGSFLPIPAVIIISFSMIATIMLFFILKTRFKMKIHLLTLPKSILLCIAFISFIILIPRMNFLSLPISREIHFPYIGDETKHIAVLTSIASTRSFPPRFPYDPTLPFPYYYFFYLVPGTILKLFPHASPGIIWFVHVLLSQIMVYTVFATVIFTITNKRWVRLLGMGLAFFGSSFKIIPKLLHFWNITEPHIEHWWQIPGDAIFGKPALIGWQITHPVTIAVWTPQHQWAAMLAALIFLFIVQKKMTIPFFIITSILLTTLIGTSAFVAATIFIVLGLYVLASHTWVADVAKWGITFAIPLVLTLPLLKIFSTNQAGIFFSPYLPMLPHLPHVLGVPVFYLFETGFVIPILMFLLIKGKPLTKKTTLRFLVLATFAPLILSRLVASQFMNDIGMRIPIVYSTFMPFCVVFLLDKIRLRQRMITILLVLSIILSIGSGLLEVYFQSSKVETYTTLISRIYQVTMRFTNPDDIIVMNDAYLADRMPLFAARMTIKPTMPFSMDVYVPKRDNKGEKYPQAMCPIYAGLLQKLPSAHVVYAELTNVAPLPCKEIVDGKQDAKILFTSPSVTLYRLR